MTKLQLAVDPLNIVVCGIGGQGNILASEILGSALVEKGYRVAVGETYGASQRGGSVMSHIRVSVDSEMSVLISRGQAQIIMGFEPLETLRMVRRYGNKDTIVIYDSRVAYPMSVLLGEAGYPALEDIEAEIRSRCARVCVLPATEMASAEGNPKGANIALMGALIAVPEMPLGAADFLEALEKRFSGRVLELNRKVFSLGYEALAKPQQTGGQTE